VADDKAQVPVVTLNSLRELAAENPRTRGQESVGGGDGEAQAVYDRALDKLEAETAKVGSSNVLITVQDREASLLQSRIAEQAETGRVLPGGGLEAKFGEGFTGGDWFGWIGSLVDHIRQKDWHPIMRPPDDKAAAFADKGRVAVLGDWGTNLYGAPVSAASIKKTGGYELLLHLGDIYYSGTSKEAKQRFLQVWPTAAGKVNRACNGNHEMYSGGFAYFDEILPAFQQPSSYFAMQNANWLLVGLDTAHTDHALDDRQVSWLQSVVQKGKPRKVILFSHHQPFSRLSDQGPKLQQALAGLFAANAITAWYWGHEHDCIIYEKKFGLLGRCVGHGGIPAPRKSEVKNAPDASQGHGIKWKRLAQTGDSPACLVLDGENPLVKGEESKFGPHGYVTLDFDGPQLTERVHLPDGTEIYKGLVA
jgi:hypothetical protein